MISGTVSRDQTRHVHIAGFWIRSLAGALDLLVLAPVLLACALALRLALPVPSGAEAELASWLLEMLIERNPMVLAAGAFVTGVMLAYVGIFTGLCGRTIGQRILGLEVIDDQGEAPGWLPVVMRTAALPVGLFFVGLGVLWIAFDREAQGFHDHVAGTLVIRATRGHLPRSVAPGDDPATEVRR